MSLSPSFAKSALVLLVLLGLIAGPECRASASDELDLVADDPPAWWGVQDDILIDASSFLEVLAREAAAFRAHPLDLNRATASELARIPGVDPATAARIVSLRAARGPFTGIEDLHVAGGLPPETAQAIRPYVFCGRPDGESNVVLEGASVAGVSRQGAEAEGAPPSRVPGGLDWSARIRSSVEFDPSDRWAAVVPGEVLDAARTFTRLRVSTDSGWKAGVGTERDPWERALLDHVSFHVTWGGGAGPGGASGVSLTAGDVLVDLGQGLIWSSGTFASRTRFPRLDDRFRGYDGAGETSARRGLLLTASRGRVSGKLIVTRTPLDASLDGGLVTSIRGSGHHRTESERSGRDALKESCVAGRLTVSPGDGLRIGATALSLAYSPPLAPGHAERQRFRFHGDGCQAASLDVVCRTAKWAAAAELAFSSVGGRAFVASVRRSGDRVSARAGCGHMSREYWLPSGGGLPDVSGGTNGTCAWVALRYRPTGGVGLRVEASVAGRPWRSYHDELPNSAERMTVGANVHIPRIGALDVEQRVLNSDESDDGTVKTTISRNRLSLRTTGASPAVLTVVRSSTRRNDSLVGVLVALGCRWEHALGKLWLLSAGATTTHRRGDASPHVVLYEPGLPGSFALRALSAAGTRWYIRLTAGFSDHVGATARASGGPERGQFAFGLCVDLKG